MEEVSELQLENLFKSRRSYYPKHYTGEQISDSVVETILSFAGMAPNHKKTKPWRFKIFKETPLNGLVDNMKDFYLENTPQDAITELKLKKFEEKKQKTSHILAILVKIDEKKRVPEIEESLAVGCAVENISLALSTFGLGGYWSTGKYTYSPSSRAYLKLESDELLLGFFVLGVLNEAFPKAEPESINNYISWAK